MSLQPDIYQSIQELDCSELDAFLRKGALEVAKAIVIEDSKVKGKVTIDLTIEKTQGSGQLLITHKGVISRPTMKGKLSEEHTGSTLVYADSKGHLSVLPHEQESMNFNS